MGLKIFDFRSQNIVVSDKDVFILTDTGIQDEEGKKTNMIKSLTASQKQLGTPPPPIYYECSPRTGWHEIQV